MHIIISYLYSLFSFIATFSFTGKIMYIKLLTINQTIRNEMTNINCKFLCRPSKKVLKNVLVAYIKFLMICQFIFLGVHPSTQQFYMDVVN